MLRPTLAVVMAAILASAAQAAFWITPDWPEGKEPRYAPVPLYWFEVRECPVVYRTEISVPPECDRATILARTSGYIYVYVDGKLAYGWAPRPRTKDSPGVPADSNQVHEVELFPRAAAGRCVLAVSAPAKGFVLEGGLYAGTRLLAGIASDGKWAAAKFAPTTILEEQPFMRPDFKGQAAPVKAGEEWKADEDALARAYYAAALAAHRKAAEDLAWRLDLLLVKGICLDGGSACFYGTHGPRDVADEVMELRTLTGVRGGWVERPTISEHLADAERAPVRTAADLEKALPHLRKAAGLLLETGRRTESLSQEGVRGAEAAALALASAAIGGGPRTAPIPGADLRSLRERLEREVRHPLPRLNESRYDRLGWINHPGLTDSDISKWGVRVGAAAGPAKVEAPRRWLFSADPKDQGVRELRWSIGYNIETQMTALPVGPGWQADPRFADYKGAAWYRVRLHVPGEWAGNEVVLTLPVAGQERLWLNGKELTARGTGQGVRTYKVPAEAVNFGGENVLALRIAADGQRRGLVGTVQAACPALEGDAARKAPPVGIQTTPLSPCVLLWPATDTLEIHHAGKARLYLPGSGRPLLPVEKWDGSRGKIPGGNWALVWLGAEGPAPAARPILLVFEKNPAAIACEAGPTRITAAARGSRIIAVRPWAKAAPPSPEKDPGAVAAACSLWSRAALAVPVDYMGVTRVLRPGEPYDGISIDKVPAGPVLGHTIIYDYLETKDEWGTQPLRLAPLPSLCSYAADCKFRGLVVKDHIAVSRAGDRPEAHVLAAEVLQDGGLLAPYRGIAGADRVSYSYPVEPYPRLAGFTSWMFAGGDAGVTGNGRECELLAWTGANSFRPQHNWSDEPPPRGMFPAEEKRSRVQILADCCRAAGINYMNNIDQTLGRRREEVQADYDKFIPLVYDHYEKIARQLGGRAFWEVAYDLVNEPFDHKHQKYNPAMKELTRRVRAIDRRHLLYIEPCEAWGAIQQMALVEPTGDPLTAYSFHDYNFRLHRPADRWPTLEKDITNIYQMWLPAIVFQIKHGVCLHCGEFGGFAESTNDTLAQALLMNDFFRIFDQFGMHHHYYTGRGIYERPADGSLRPSNVARAYRAYFGRGDFNIYYKKWPGHRDAR